MFRRFMKPYKLEAVLGPLFKLFEATLELIVPLVIALIIDNGINGAGGVGDKPYIIRMTILLALFAFVGLAFSVIAQYFAAKASVGFVTNMRSALFAHLTTLSYTEIDTLGESTMISRITTDADKVQTGLNLGLRLLLRSPFVVFGAMIMAFTVDVKSALIFTVAIPLLSVVVFGIMLASIPLYKKVQARLDRVLLKTRENLSGARVIRAFSKEDEEIFAFENENTALVKIQKFVGAISALMNPLTFIIINFAVIILIYTGALEINSGELTQGELIALYNYMSQILVELIKLANLIISITRSLASASRIRAVLETESSMKDGNSISGMDSDTLVEFSDVSLCYNGARENSLSGISFKARRGETIGIIGGTGSGKTSLVNLIPRFYDATSGMVLIDGADIKTYTQAALRKKIGVVPQRAALFSGTIRDNMLWGKKDASDEEIFRALEIAQAKSTVLDKGGLDAEIEEGGANLSGGQKQRLTIARALVGSPEILILDDSASALDFATDKALRNAIGKIENTTVFIVSQRCSSVMTLDKILVLDDGILAAVGTHDELLKSSPLYREIYESQFGKEVEKI